MIVKLSVIVSLYNEEDSIVEFKKRLIEILDSMEIFYEVIFVNDGSSDQSKMLLNSFIEDKKIKIINFSRNYGHEAAMISGIDKSRGEAIICMDADMQHPPELIPKIYNKYQTGFDIVMMIRNKGNGGFLKNVFSKTFYAFINKLSDIKIEPSASDFFLISDRIANVLRSDYREKTRFLRGFIQHIGFNRTKLEYDASQRFAGKSKYSFIKLLLYSISAIATTSKAPLKIGLTISFFYGVFAVFLGLFSIVMNYIDEPISGYTTIIVFMSFSFSVVFFILGIIGEYIGFMFFEIKNRPIYIIEDTINFD